MTVPRVIDEPVRGGFPDPMWLASLPGPERVRALMDGRVPRSPVQRLMGMRMTQVGHGRSTCVMPASPWFQTQAGFFLSGVTALAADFALGSAIATVLPPWHVPVTSDLNFTYMRPVRVDAEKLIAQARLVDSGRNQGVAECVVEDANGRLLAHATTRCFIKAIPEGPPGAPPGPEEPAPSPDPWERPLPADLPRPVETASLSGLEFLRAVASGAQPEGPWGLFTGMRFAGAQVEPGSVEIAIPATSWLCSPSGTIYGGALAAIADGLTTAAATTALEPGTATASLDLKVHFLRPGLAGPEPMTGTGTVLHGGKGLIVARSEVRDPAGKPVVVAAGSFMRRPIRDWVPVV